MNFRKDQTSSCLVPFPYPLGEVDVEAELPFQGMEVEMLEGTQMEEETRMQVEILEQAERHELLGKVKRLNAVNY